MKEKFLNMSIGQHLEINTGLSTKERLNALPNVNIIQRNFKWFLNGKVWNGEKTNINYKNQNHV